MSLRPTEEEIQFEAEFQIWREKFNDWKRANSNNPDQISYHWKLKQLEAEYEKILEVNKISTKNLS